RIEVLLSAYSARTAENARRARTDLFGIKNGRKVRDGALAGLLDPKLLARKQAAEDRLRSAINAQPAVTEVQGAWDRIADAQKVFAEHAKDEDMLERSYGFYTVLFTFGRQLLRAAEERDKPDGERLEEFRESVRASLEFALFAEQPVYEDLETLKLGDSLTWLCEELGYNHPLVQKILRGKSPRDRAAEAVRGSKLADAGVRRQLYNGGQNALEKANDPMIELARLVDPDARAVRKIVEVEREAVRQAHARIGRARYALEGPSSYPDATGTLRLAFGPVKGYVENGRQIPFETRLAGLYERAAEQNYRPPFDVPQRWLLGRKKLDLRTPFNFVSTADIIGGNSGSPVINRKGEFVGIIFDGNIQSLTGAFL